MLIDAVPARALPVARQFNPGEDHEFKQRAHIIQPPRGEIAFYGKIMGFVPQGVTIQPDIRNGGD